MSLQGRRLLLIDDDELVVGAWTLVLARHGVTLTTARSVQEGRKTLSETDGQRLDYVVLDDHLSDGFGLDIVPALNALRPIPPFVVVTANPSTERGLRGWQNHVVIVPKPTSPASILSLVASLEARRVAQTARVRGPHDKPLVLVVEDSPEINALICESIGDAFRTESAFDGAEGIGKALELLPDMIVSDLVMPRVGGVELVKILRERIETHAIPIIVITGNADDSVRSQLLRDGVQDYLMKPFSDEELRARLGNLISITRTRALLQADLDESQRDLETLASDVMRQKQTADFLSEASKVLASSSDIPAVLQRVLRLFVTRVADGAMIDLIDAQQRVDNVGVAHAQPDQELALIEFRRQFAPARNAPHGLFRALHNGAPVLLHDIASQVASRAPADPALPPLRALRDAGVRAMISVPLTARGQIIGVLTEFHTSQMRRRSQAGGELVEELAQRISLALDSARLYREATDAIKVRDEFLSIAAHELKTPLNPLQLQLQSLERKVDEFTIEPQRARVQHKLATIRRQTERLTRLVNELLDIARISGGQLQFELESINLSAVVQDVVSVFEERGELERSRCTIVLQLEDEVVGRWDRMRLEQLVTNLLSNALKYGAQHSVVLSTRLRNGVAALDVTDQGIGIAPADQERIFDRFERAVSSRHYGGLGLGLFIVRQIAEGLGGNVTVASQPGAFTTFSVFLPIEGVPEMPAAQASATPARAITRDNPGA